MNTNRTAKLVLSSKVISILAVLSLLFPAVVMACTADAGTDKYVDEGQKISFSDASAYDASSYYWSCTGGYLSSSSVLNPTYTAPSVSSDTNYTCTLTVQDNMGWTDSDYLIVHVRNVEVNHAPTVNAGYDKDINEGQQVTLSASASDPDGDSMTYNWTCDKGTLNNYHFLSPTYTAPSVTSDTSDVCSLTATDSHGLSSSPDSVSITIRNIQENRYPVAEAGPNKQVNENQSVSLSGSASDPDGDSMTYSWSCSGSDSLSNRYSLNPTYNAPSVSNDANYICTLTVTDSHGLTDTDTMTVTVRNLQENSYPVAEAGPNKYVNENQSVTLSGSASDPDGDSMTYSWSCSGSGSLSNRYSLNPTYGASSVSSDATYTCTLTVTDSHGLTDTDTMTVTVRNEDEPESYPTVYAGGTIYIDSGESVIIQASASDPNNSPLTYSWTCNGGNLSNYHALRPLYYAPDISGNETYTCTITATNGYGNSAKSSASIVVNGNDYGNLYVNLSANPSSGSAPLNNVNLTANVSGSTAYGLIVYRFDCQNDGFWDRRYESYNNSYTAYDVCSYPNSGNYTAKVRVEKGSNMAENTTNIYVSGGYSNYITVDAGSNKDILQGQSVILYGSASSQSGYPLTYNWTCTGGRLSNNYTISPLYYAPTYVNYDTTYTCTLYASDNRGNSNSDSMSVIVRRSGSYGNLSVTTNNAESIGMNYATLKGTLNNDGGQNAWVKFDWGRSASYSNSTSWIYDKRSGNIFTFNITGLEKGKVYHFRAEAANGKDTAMGQDMVFITKPDSPINLDATAVSSSQIQLTWTKGEGSCYTKVVRKRYGYPTNALDGVAVYYDSDTSYLDKGLSPSTTYYYRAWAVACDEGKYSFSDSPNTKDYAVTGPGAVVERSEILLETLARNFTQDEKDWNDYVSANSGDEIEFNIIVSADGDRTLENVIVKNTMPGRIGCIYDAEVDGDEYDGSLETVKLGNISVNRSKVISFKGIIDSEPGPNCRSKTVNVLCGSNNQALVSEASARNAETVERTLRIGVSNVAIKTGITTADIGKFLRDKFSVSSLILLMLILIFLMMLYMIFDRREAKEKAAKKGFNAFRSPNM